MGECAICGKENLKYSVEVHAGCLATITDEAKIDRLTGLLRMTYANLPLDSGMRKELKKYFDEKL